MTTGGLALDSGLNVALNESMEKLNLKCTVTSSPDSIYGGAIGAALWGAYRYGKLAELEHLSKAS
jgi:benzoyl-CoA reductase subunit D